MKRKKLIGGVPAVLVAAGVVFLVVVALIGGCGGEQATSSSEDEAAKQDAAGQKSEPEKTESAEESAASIGEPVTIGNVQWIVTDVLHSDIVESRLGTEEGNFIIVDVTFRNNSNQDITLATPFLTLLDSEGHEIEADIKDNFIHVWASENMFVDHVQPGVTKEGKVIFRVDPGASGFKLRVGEGNFASKETRLIDLGV